MADIVSTEKRSRMMAGIRGKDTQPERTIAKGLFRAGFRYRLNVKSLPGKPDIVLRRYNAVIFVHGCFWHGHEPEPGHRCHLFKWPKSRVEFWRTKIETNRVNDERAEKILREQGWRVCVVWECALKGKLRLPLDSVIRDIAEWLRSERPRLEIRGETGWGERSGRTSGNSKSGNHQEIDGN